MDLNKQIFKRIVFDSDPDFDWDYFSIRTLSDH